MKETALRIVIITNNYTPYSGGVVSSIQAFEQELKARGHSIFIITLDFLGAAAGVDEKHVFRICCPLKFTYKKNCMAVPAFADYQVRQLLKELNPDIIHSQHPFLLGVSGYKAARQLAIPIVFTYHTVYEDCAHFAPFPLALTQFMVKRMVTRYCKLVDGIIAPSTTIKQRIHGQRIKTPTRIIPSGVQSVFMPAQKPIKSRVPGEPFKLLVVSRFSKEKNIKFLIDLFARLDHAKFHLTLIGYGNEFESLQAHAYQTLGITADALTIHHQPDKRQIAQAYGESDLFLHASLTDVQPLTLIEAMAGATPIVALRGPGRDTIVHGGNGYVVDTADGMIECLMSIEKDALLHKELQDNAWLTAQKFKREHTTDLLLNFYRDLIESHTGKR